MTIHKPKKSKKASIIAYKVMEQVGTDMIASLFAKDSASNQHFTFNVGQKYHAQYTDGFRAYRTLAWARFMRDHITLNSRDRNGIASPRKLVVVKVQLHDVTQEGYELNPQTGVPAKTHLRSRLYVANECEFLEIRD